jgi:hypothetical protein
LNEYELDLLGQRSVEARRAKAQRGELLVAAPVGFLKTDAPHFEKDPDRRIQEAIALVFQKFGELGTVRQTLSWFLEHDLQLPARSVSGEITWRRPSFGVLYRMLSNPIYGGAYTYGKTESTIRYEAGAASSRRRPREEWLAFIPQVTSAGTNLMNRQTMAPRGRGITAGAETAWRLTGLLRCRRCGRKLVVCYTGDAHNVLRSASEARAITGNRAASRSEDSWSTTPSARTFSVSCSRRPSTPRSSPVRRWPTSRMRS